MQCALCNFCMLYFWPFCFYFAKDWEAWGMGLGKIGSLKVLLCHRTDAHSDIFSHFIVIKIV